MQPGIKIFSHKTKGVLLLQIRAGDGEVIELGLKREQALQLAQEILKHAQCKRSRTRAAKPNRSRRKPQDKNRKA